MSMTHKKKCQLTVRIRLTKSKKYANSVVNIETRRMTNILPVYLVMN
jgi:hypothetical protein